jgi:hypothetical protein
MLGAIHNLSHSLTPFYIYPHPSLSFHSSSHSFSTSIPKLLTLFLHSFLLFPLPLSLCLSYPLSISLKLLTHHAETTYPSYSFFYC